MEMEPCGQNRGTDIVEHIRKFLDSEEGKQWVKDRNEKERRNMEVESRWQAKFENLSNEKKEEVLEKLIAHYDSEKYIRRWYDRGIEPPCDLLFSLAAWANTYNAPKYIPNGEWMFVVESYVILGKYWLRILCGQGTVAILSKLDGNEILVEFLD